MTRPIDTPNIYIDIGLVIYSTCHFSIFELAQLKRVCNRINLIGFEPNRKC
jgi:hypothetical protein